MKYVELDFSDGEIWLIPLEVIAKNRTDFYKERAEEDFDYEEEFNFVMEDDYEGIDWLKNNMNYEDFEDDIIVKTKSTSKDWCNADSRIVEEDLQ